MNTTEFIDAIVSAGLGAPDIIADGELHRFPTPNDRHRDKSGWYVCFGDAGAFGDWRTGLNEKWSHRSEGLTRKERAALKASIDADRRKRQAEQLARHTEVAARASELWNCAAEAMWHPYLKNKRVLPLGIRQHNDLLVIPLTDTDGKVWSVQTIDQDGRKRFLSGGRKKACFCQIGGPIKDHFYLCEGWATGATIHMHLDEHAPVIVAFDAGNLLPVAQALRLKYPDTGITIAADNDRWGEVNIGLDKGREAAAAIGAELIYPTFKGLDLSSKPTDFNDAHCLEVR